MGYRSMKAEKLMNSAGSIGYSWLWVLLLLLTGCQSSPPNYPPVQISRVISGQAIEWVDRSQQPPVIQQGRLSGIDAPALEQEPWGKQAKQCLEASLATTGKESIRIELESADADRYGRKFVYLWKDGNLINERLLKDGCVLQSMRVASATNTNGAKYRDRFDRSARYARLMGFGIWNPSRPLRVSPAEFRKEEG
jgi:micrococcal nuclease